MAKKTDRKNSHKRNVAARTQQVKFVSDDSPAQNGLENITNHMRSMMGSNSAVQQQQKDMLFKSSQPMTIRRDRDVNQNIEKSKIVFSSKLYEQGMGQVELKGYSRLEDHELKEVAQLDPYLSAIISVRCSQGAVIARKSDSKFDKGTRVLDLQPCSLEDFQTQEEYDRAQESRSQQQQKLLDWAWNCGTVNKDVIDEAYSDPYSDKLFKYCTLADYITAQIRNLLTFGRIGTQIIRDETGLPLLFRPVPIETIHPVIQKRDVHIGHGPDTLGDSEEDAHEYNDLQPEDRPIAYIQMVDGKQANFLTEDELRVSYFQKQALFDLNGYPMAPIEMAIYMVYIHQQTLGYLRNQFVKGIGTKGILSLNSSDVASELSMEDLESLRNQFHNFLNRTDNSAVTPVISGPVEVNWIPLSAVPREMEFLQVEEHVIRALCSALQTSPQEMGYGHLSINNGGLTQQNKQEEIVRGEERGLRMLLDIIYDDINAILYEHFKDAEDNFRITYTGVGEDTRDAVVSRHQQELQTTATLSSLWADSEKNDPIPAGGDVPLAPLFHENVVRYMKYGQFMEDWFGYKDWGDPKKHPEYDFVIDPQLNQAYMQRIGMNNQLLRAQSEIEVQTAEEQLESLQQQTEAMEAQNEMMMQQGGAPEEGQEPTSDEQMSGQQPQPEAQEIEKSKTLADAYAQRLTKSQQPKLSQYFANWIKAHNPDDVNEEEFPHG